ncbi:MAG: 2-amino-4-hydroxy-6-hydroxymethyldihydropteridine diphosphokinase [Planctomycetota bacterium]
MTKAYVGLGSNIGDRAGYISQAVRLLTQTDGICVVQTSRIIETASLDHSSQTNYLNSVAYIETALPPQQLLRRLVQIENSLGRLRTQKWAERTIDLDLLVFGDEIINSEDLTVPHPQMHLRYFVLKGLDELAAGMIHPVLHQPIGELLHRLNGCSYAIRPDQPRLISIGGLIGVGKTTLARALAEKLSCMLLLEAYDTNPYLADVYNGKSELALESQLYFLNSRAEQLSASMIGPGRAAVSDYVFEKELIYADKMLDTSQRKQYNKQHEHIAADIVSPVLAIYLEDAEENCLERIHRRNRSYEQKIDLEFLHQIRCAYEDLFAGWTLCPLIRLRAVRFDSTSDKEVERLANEVKYYTA